MTQNLKHGVKARCSNFRNGHVSSEFIKSVCISLKSFCWGLGQRVCMKVM